MRRRTTQAEIQNTIDKLRERIPDIHIRTTLIVGFPGETEEDFDNLYDFVESNKFERLGVFKYSREEGTAAAKMSDQVDEEIKENRLDAIMNLQMGISLQSNKEKIGRIMPVIIDEIEEDGYVGRTQYDAFEIDNSVIFTTKENNSHKVGDIVDVRIIDAYDYDLVGEEA